MTATVVHSWQGLGGQSDIMLEPGSYALSGTASVTIQRITERIPEGPPHWPTADDKVIVRAPARAVLATPVAIHNGAFTILDPGEFRVTRGPGALTITQD